jgi:hypothetical protein
VIFTTAEQNISRNSSHRASHRAARGGGSTGRGAQGRHDASIAAITAVSSSRTSHWNQRKSWQPTTSER